MSFHGKHDGVPCQNPYCALPIDVEGPITDLTDVEVKEIMDKSFGEPESEEDETFTAHIIAFNNEFEDMCAVRHEFGSQKYGAGKFLTVDTIEEALQEIVDLSNYARYTFIRLRILQEAILQNTAPNVQQPSGFMSAKSATTVRN